MEHPSSLGDYKPIVCCTIIYKIISKVLAIILGKILCIIINLSQSAFIPGSKGEHSVGSILNRNEIKKLKNQSIEKCQLKLNRNKRKLNQTEMIRYDLISVRN